MSDAPFSLAKVVGPIFDPIGYDFKRIGEVTDADLFKAYEAHAVTNFAMTAQLVADVGDKDVADRMLLHARGLTEAKQRRRREQFAEVVERIGKAPPRLLAAHIVYSFDLEHALAVEIERRRTPMN